MKPYSPVDFTYMSHLYNAHYTNDMADEQHALALMQKIKRATKVQTAVSPVFFAIDYKKQSYFIMSDNVKGIMGCDVRDFLNGGLQFFVHDFILKEDFEVYNKKVFAANNQFITSVPFDERDNYVFRFNFRIKSHSGAVKHILFESCYVTATATGVPLYSLGTVTNISDYKNDSVIIHKIDKLGFNNDKPIRQTIAKNFFYPGKDWAELSNQEKLVLNYMADGFSSKMIADKLNISENTISNHRQNMLRKTNTHNVAQLIAFAIHNRII